MNEALPPIARYKIGYHADEWGQRSSTPGGIPDHAGSWVRYADHVAALAEAQQPVPSAAVALSDDLRDRLVAISAAIADQDDRAAQAMLREILKAPQPSPTAQDPSQPGGFDAGDMASAAAQGYRDGWTAAQPVPAAVAGPVAVLKFERGTPGRQNEMPRVVSCNWMPDGEYEVYLAAAPTTQPAPATQQAGERVYAFRRKGLADFCTCDEARYEELSNKPHLFETRIFYTAPQPLAAQAPAAEPVHGDVLPPVGGRVFIRHGRDDDTHACIVTGYYAWGDLKGDKHLHRVFVRMVYEGTSIEQARMLCDCYPTAGAALAATSQPSPTPQADSQPAPDERDDFEKVFPLPSGCIRVGTGYASTGYSNWAAHTHCERWQGWQARAARSPADSVLGDAARYRWLADYLVGDLTDLDDEIVACKSVYDLSKVVDAAASTKLIARACSDSYPHAGRQARTES